MILRKKKRVKLERIRYKEAEEIIRVFAKSGHFDHIKPERVFCYLVTGSKARAYARTWMIPKVFYDALGMEPVYVIEFIEKHYGRLGDGDKKKVIIHELLHIPKNFSGALRPHKYGGKTINAEVKRISKLLEL